MREAGCRGARRSIRGQMRDGTTILFVTIAEIVEDMDWYEVPSPVSTALGAREFSANPNSSLEGSARNVQG